MFKKMFRDYFYVEITFVSILLFLLVTTIILGTISVSNGASIFPMLYSLAVIIFLGLLVLTYMYHFKSKAIKCFDRKIKPIIRIGGLCVLGNLIKVNSKWYFPCTVQKDIYGDLTFYRTESNPTLLCESSYFKIMERIFDEDPVLFNELVSDTVITFEEPKD